ncbi:MAG: hypothetical protein K2J77_04655 [Oscillospiraceae bacterium]|nr:hypothetical protein [Oscillospiraceae bacterium]
MKSKKLSAKLVAITVAAAAMLSGCTKVPEAPTSSTPANSNPTSTPTGTTSDTETSGASDPGSATAAKWEQTLTFAAGTELRMATGYNNANTGLTFTADKAGSGITLADGKTYNAGDLKPTWVAVQNKLGFTIKDQYQGKSASEEFEYWKAQMDQVDIVSGTASKLTENKDLLINLAEHLDEMPFFKAYLNENPIVRLSITGDTSNGGIYFSPYFDGVNDIERMPLMRTDWVQKLLDGDGEFTADKSNNTAAPVYQPYMPTTGTVPVDVVKLDGSGTEKVTKDYGKAGNIVAKMNEKGSMTGVEAVNMLRKYIDEAYNGYYGTARSNLFIGQNAAWDADELVALLRCVVANPQTLNGTDTVEGLFSREDENNQRRVDMFRFAGHLFGVRGLESRQDYLFVGTDGKLHDARQEADTYEALDRMNAMGKEGLLSKNFLNAAEAHTDNYLENDAGFMHYDYNQTQTAYNATKLQDGEQYMAVMVPVARWYDGTSSDGVYMRFTESWRSVKTDGWGISKKGVEGNEDKLKAALTLIDYAFSPEGQILMSYGPDEFIKTNADGSYVTFNFNGKEMPVIADATYAELWKLEKGGSYTNYARFYLGSTLSFAKSQAFEYQCTHEVGRIGAGYISNAIGYGTIKHPELAITSNPWYTSVPTVLPHTDAENNEIKTFDKLASKGEFSSSKGDKNLLVDIIASGYSGQGTSSAAETITTVSNDWGGATYLELKNDAWNRLKKFYEGL